MTAEAKYELQPAPSENERLLDPDAQSDDDHDDEDSPTPIEEPVEEDTRFHQPTPSPIKRVALLLFIAFLFWLAFSMRRSLHKAPPKVVHATRYSKEHRFRPAASPIITETLKDGRVRLRGAQPTAVPSAATVTPEAKKAKQKRGGKGRRRTKKKLTTGGKRS